MSDQNSTNTNEPVEEFGIDSNTNSSNVVNFPGGFNKAELVSVKSHKVGKTEQKFPVLDFKFVSLDRINTFVHREFVPKGKATNKETTEQNYVTRKGWFNSRVKHIYEAYATFPKDTLGAGVKSWEGLFDAIATAFNTNNNGKEIYYKYDGEKAICIPVWIKNTFSTGGDIQFPLLPNFIERITPETNTSGKPKTLEATKYDQFVMPAKKENNSNVMGANGVVGGNQMPNNPAPASSNDMGF